MNCNTTHYRANSSSVPGDPTGSATYQVHLGVPPAGRGSPAPPVDPNACRVRLNEDETALIVERPTANGLSQLTLPVPSLETDLRAKDIVTSTVAVTARGPVHSEWSFTTRTAEGMQEETRVAAFAASCTFRIQHTIINTTAVRSTTAVRHVTLGLTAATRTALVGIDGHARRLASVIPQRELRQLDADTAFLDTSRDGEHLDGWAQAIGDDLTITAMVRDLWQQFPAGFRIAADRFDVDLLAAPETPIALGVGAAKTFEAWVAIAPTPKAAPPPEQVALEATALRHPLLGTVPPAWVVSSGALPQALAPDNDDVRDALRRLQAALQQYRRRNATERWDDGPPVPCDQRKEEHPRTGSYGVLNWGDWNFPHYRDMSEGCDAWGNLEYDLPQVLGLLWAATGDPSAREEFVAASRHFRDVDIIHAMPSHSDWVGMNHPHKMSHFAVEATNQIDLGHTWVEGLLTHYRLTGEVRSLAAARGIAAVLATSVDKAGNPRQLGWPLIALIAVHTATGDEAALAGARRYAARALADVPPSPASGDWKMGILADGLAYYDAATNDPAARRWLLQYADAWMANRTKFADPRYALPVGYLAAVTRNRAYRAAAIDVAQHIKVGEWGKTFAATGRTLIRLLAPLALQPATNPVAVSPRARADLRPRSGAARPRSSPSPSGSSRHTAH